MVEMKIEGDPKGISTAFIKARGEMGATVATDARGNFGKYATLAALVEATSATFANHGLAIVQEAAIDEVGVVVETWLLHESGATMQFAPLTMPLTKRDAQAVGSAITYARRYQLAAVCGLAPDDDDGQAATDAQRKPQQQAVRPPSAQRQQAPQAQHRRVDTETGEITNNVNPFDDAPTEGPNDDELAILSTWKNPQDAQAWAVEIKACENEHHARESFKKIVDANGGKLTKENIGTVYLQFLRRQNEKLEQEKAAM